MRRIRTTTFLTTALLLAACGGGADSDADMDAAPAAEAADPDVTPTGEATGLPAGFQLALDDASNNAADFHVMTMGDGFHIETGPRGVLYNPGDAVAAGDYTVSATFTEMTPPRANHREAYGIIIGGSGLDGADQAYAYFIIRGDGSYLVRQRQGANTMNVGGDWTSSEAIHPTPAEGGNENLLEVAVRGDQVHFSVNGTEVATIPASDVPTHGGVGIRMNHNLNVMVSNWTVTRGS